ncbi:MAG: polyketide cyclase, partial [Huintestinicola sp.]
MAVSIVKAVFQKDVKSVWDIVTSLENYSWRSDISKIEVVDDKKFIEYTPNGFETNFTVTEIEQYKRWEFDMENDNIKGHWTGIFSDKG